MRSIYHPDVETLAEAESVRLAKLEEKTKGAVRRLDRLERLTDEIHTQNERLAGLVVKLEHLTVQLEKQEKRLSEIEHVPIKRYTTVIGAIITALASAIVGGAVTALF